MSSTFDDLDTATERLRAAPWSNEAEQSILGALLVDNAAWDRISDVLETEAFYAMQHRLIFDAIGVLIGSGKPADIVTVFERLQAGEKAEQAGGLPYLNALEASVPSAAHIRRYAEIVVDKALRRKLIAAGDEIRSAAADDGAATDIVDACVTKLDALQQAGQRGEVQGIDRILSGRMDHYNDLAEGKVPTGLSTGIPELDDALGGGMREGKVIVVAARPGVGKTALSLQILTHCAVSLDRTALMLSQEMENAELADRCVANIGRISYAHIVNGKFSDREWGNLAEAVDKLGNAPIHFDDQPALTLRDIRVKAFSLRRRGLRVMAIDYVQLCAGSKTSRRENRNTEIEEISRGVKQLAKELGITVLLLSQLSRDVERRATPKPTLADLRDSGAIEQDADVVLMLWPVRHEGGDVTVGAYTPKNRQGKPNTEWTMKFQGYWQRFTEDIPDTAHRGLPQRQGGFDA